MNTTETNYQTTIGRPATISGVGFFNGVDTNVRLLPAQVNTGIQLQRTDIPQSPRIPATIDYLIPSHRRTVLGIGDVTVEMTEHLLAALAGLGIDNCLVQIDAPEVPGGDGSAQSFVDAILGAGIIQQSAVRLITTLDSSYEVEDQSGASITARPNDKRALAVSFELDYGPTSPFSPQQLRIEISPDTFANEIAFARTFVLEEEIEALQELGYGSRVTAADLVVFRKDGSVLENKLRSPDECVRHKILDCIGDLALIGGPIHGLVSASRSGHSLNHELARQIKSRHASVARAA